ncbi:unnamed protein product [Amoebophrya sp. A120]|nr:unnamed protein product [Amoebophrya sp. A120]|eukprot:GSA120T00012375001.1
MVHGTLITFQEHHRDPPRASSTATASTSTRDIKILVDGFQSKSDEVKHYILSHFHSDHTQGLGKGFKIKNAKIYCTPLTADLITEVTGVRKEFVVPVAYNTLHWLPEDIETPIRNGEHQQEREALPRSSNTYLVFLDANHCPGAAIMLLGNLREKKCVLHCGDFRGTPVVAAEVKKCLKWLANHYSTISKLAGLQHDNINHFHDLRIDTIYLDNTYCSPKWVFPSQLSVLKQLKQFVIQQLRNHPDKKILWFIGSYAIGKEKVAAVVAETIAEYFKREGGPQLTVKTERRWSIQKLVQKHYPEFDYFTQARLGDEEAEDAGCENYSAAGGKSAVQVQDQTSDDNYGLPQPQLQEKDTSPCSFAIDNKKPNKNDVWMVPLSDIRHDKLLKNLALGPEAVLRTERQLEAENRKLKNRTFDGEGFLPKSEYEEVVENATAGTRTNRKNYKATRGQKLKPSDEEQDKDALAIISGLNRGTDLAGDNEVVDLLDDEDDLLDQVEQDLEKLECDDDYEDPRLFPPDQHQQAQQEEVLGVRSDKDLLDVDIPAASDPLVVPELPDENRFYESNNRPSKRKQATIAKHAAGVKMRRIEKTGVEHEAGRRQVNLVEPGASTKTTTTEGQLVHNYSHNKLHSAVASETAFYDSEEQQQFLEIQSGYDMLIGFRPTGWAYRSQSTNISEQQWVSNNGKTKVVHFPYSEHSSFSELKGFVKALKPRDVIPTVPDSSLSIPEIKKYFLDCTDGSNDKSRIEYYMRKMREDQEDISRLKKQKSDLGHHPDHEEPNVNLNSVGSVFSSDAGKNKMPELHQLHVEQQRLQLPVVHPPAFFSPVRRSARRITEELDLCTKYPISPSVLRGYGEEGSLFGGKKKKVLIRIGVGRVDADGEVEPDYRAGQNQHNRVVGQSSSSSSTTTARTGPHNFPSSATSSASAASSSSISGVNVLPGSTNSSTGKSTKKTSVEWLSENNGMGTTTMSAAAVPSALFSEQELLLQQRDPRLIHSSGQNLPKPTKRKRARPHWGDDIDLPEVTRAAEVLNDPSAAAKTSKSQTSQQQKHKSIKHNNIVRSRTATGNRDVADLTSFLPMRSTTSSINKASTSTGGPVKNKVRDPAGRAQEAGSSCSSQLSSISGVKFVKSDPADLISEKKKVFDDGSVMYTTMNEKGHTEFRICHENRKIWDGEEVAEMVRSGVVNDDPVGKKPPNPNHGAEAEEITEKQLQRPEQEEGTSELKNAQVNPELLAEKGFSRTANEVIELESSSDEIDFVQIATGVVEDVKHGGQQEGAFSFSSATDDEVVVLSDSG